MTDETMPQGLWQETRQAADVWEQARSAREGGPAEPVQNGSVLVGQVLVLPELGEPRLAWAVLRREAGGAERRLLVVADVNPLVGSGDVAVPGPMTGPLTLRCRFAVWVNEREIRATQLLGTLPPEALALAEFRRQAVEAGRAVGTFSEQETEEDPEYQDWIEDVVRPAAGRLEARAGGSTATEAVAPSPIIPFPTERATTPGPSSRGAWMRWAAVLAFLALGAGNGLFWWWQGEKITGLRSESEASEAAHRRAIAELETRRTALEAQYQARLREAGEDRARLEAEHRARLQELETQLAALRQATEVKNPMVTSLEPGAAQRGTTRIKIAPEASQLVLLLPVNAPAGTEFQIAVSERPSGKQVFVQKGLRVDVLGEVRPGLPAALLSSGDYRLRLFRKEGKTLRLVREHLIAIDKEPRPRPARW